MFLSFFFYIKKNSIIKEKKIIRLVDSRFYLNQYDLKNYNYLLFNFVLLKSERFKFYNLELKGIIELINIYDLILFYGILEIAP